MTEQIVRAIIRMIRVLCAFLFGNLNTWQSKNAGERTFKIFCFIPVNLRNQVWYSMVTGPGKKALWLSDRYQKLPLPGPKPVLCGKDKRYL